MDLYDVSPITQRSASSRFDLPQPFGPTTPVNPFSITSSVDSTNDLNPSKRSLVMCIVAAHRPIEAEPNTDRPAIFHTSCSKIMRSPIVDTAKAAVRAHATPAM